ncbi:MAG: NnrU family protein [Hyphomicrobiales bacterium]|nr:NnrU family protein [Hyphomicrobiales bacterium]
MGLLIVGLVLFLGAHSLRTFAPAGRDTLIARLGESGYKGLYSLVALIGFLLIVWGFSRTAGAPEFLYVPFPGLRHLTELLMLIALVLAIASGAPRGYIARTVRHPLLVATILWAIAHLIVNGDVGTTVLFGAFLVWASVDLFGQRWRAPVVFPAPSWRFDIVAVVVGLALYAGLVFWAHLQLFGANPMI